MRVIIRNLNQADFQCFCLWSGIYELSHRSLRKNFSRKPESHMSAWWRCSWTACMRSFEYSISRKMHHCNQEQQLTDVQPTWNHDSNQTWAFSLPAMRFCWKHVDRRSRNDNTIVCVLSTGYALRIMIPDHDTCSNSEILQYVRVTETYWAICICMISNGRPARISWRPQTFV